MNKPEHFEIMEGYAVFRPTGEVSLEQAVQLVTSAIVFAREQQIQKLLVVIAGLSGFGAPCLADRYFYANEWARAAQGQVCVAMVTKTEWRDPQKIEADVAENAGLYGRGFLLEEEALDWLKNVKWTPQAGKIQFGHGQTPAHPQQFLCD